MPLSLEWTELIPKSLNEMKMEMRRKLKMNRFYISDNLLKNKQIWILDLSSLCTCIWSGSWNSSRSNFYETRWIEVVSVIDGEPVKESEKVWVLACESCERNHRQRKCWWPGVSLVSRAELIIMESFLQQLPWYGEQGPLTPSTSDKTVRVKFGNITSVIIGLFYRSVLNWSKRD